MAWIEPLELEKWIINVFAGSTNIFTSIAIITICGMAGYFRMNMLTLFLMVGLFLVMFSGYISTELYFIILALGSLLVGYTISKIVK